MYGDFAYISFTIIGRISPSPLPVDDDDNGNDVEVLYHARARGEEKNVASTLRDWVLSSWPPPHRHHQRGKNIFAVSMASVEEERHRRDRLLLLLRMRAEKCRPFRSRFVCSLARARDVIHSRRARGSRADRGTRYWGGIYPRRDHRSGKGRQSVTCV